MKMQITKKRILANSIVFGVIIASGLILLTLFVPILGIPLLILWIVVWSIATIMRLAGVQNIHFFGGKFLERD